nr:CinA family protein [Rhodoferax sp.]
MNPPSSGLLLNSERDTDIARGLAADLLKIRGWKLATAESCTGGLIAACCTDIAGSSDWFDRGFVTYSNAAKSEMLGVDAALMSSHGAVSEQVVRAMVRGALTHSAAQVAVAVTGVGGPGGGSDAKPVGTVWLGWATPAGVVSEVQHFAGDRVKVRAATVQRALQRLAELLQVA